MKKLDLNKNDMIIPSQPETKFLGMWLDQHIQKLSIKKKEINTSSIVVTSDGSEHQNTSVSLAYSKPHTIWTCTMGQ